MKKKTILGTLLALSLAAIITIAAVTPALASKPQSNPGSVTYSNDGWVCVQLPPPGGAMTGHPIDLKFWAQDVEKRSGGVDVLNIIIWVSALNSYITIAAIADQVPTAEVKAAYNGTPVYLEINGVVIRNNIKTVADKELDVWMERARGHDDIFIANLTVPVGPLDFTGLPPIFGSTFTVPAMTLTFSGIAEGSRQTTTANLPGFTWSQTSTMVPAFVIVDIPAWLTGIPGVSGKQTVVGNINEKAVTSITPLS
jgi:hypothetical protein